MEPENELGVIVQFSQVAESAGFRFESISASFPDAVLTRDGHQYRVEFEYQASAFSTHKHDPRECDLIICWANDYPDSPLPVLAISEDGWQDARIVLPDEMQRECAYWKQRAQLAEFRLRAATTEQERVSTKRNKNNDNGVHMCPSCGRSFGSRNALNAHGPQECAAMRAEVAAYHAQTVTKRD